MAQDLQSRVGKENQHLEALCEGTRERKNDLVSFIQQFTGLSRIQNIIL